MHITAVKKKDNLFLVPSCQILNGLSISYTTDYLFKFDNAAA
jgi:hypothetical protein